MTVIVIDNNGNKATYGYDPEHMEGVLGFYANALSKGFISSYSVEQYLTYPQKWGRGDPRACG